MTTDYGTEGNTYERNGLEPNAWGDYVSLSDDRRTLTIHMGVGPAVDQVRVIVAADVGS